MLTDPTQPGAQLAPSQHRVDYKECNGLELTDRAGRAEPEDLAPPRCELRVRGIPAPVVRDSTVGRLRDPTPVAQIRSLRQLVIDAEPYVSDSEQTRTTDLGARLKAEVDRG